MIKGKRRLIKIRSKELKSMPLSVLLAEHHYQAFSLLVPDIFLVTHNRRI